MFHDFQVMFHKCLRSGNKTFLIAGFSFFHMDYLNYLFYDLISSVLLFQFHRSKDCDLGIYNFLFNNSNVRIVTFLTPIPVLFLLLIISSHIENLYIQVLRMFYSQINLNENNLDQITSKKKILPYYITSIHFELNYVIYYLIHIFILQHFKNSRYHIYIMVEVWFFPLSFPVHSRNTLLLSPIQSPVHKGCLKRGKRKI